MSLLDWLQHWHKRGFVTAQQHAQFVSLVRQEPFSLFAELNVLLYAGVLVFVAGLGWTVTTLSRQLGDILVVALLSTIVAGSLYYCFRHVPAWSRDKAPNQGFVLDYVLYLCCLVWAVELAYLEQRFLLFTGTGTSTCWRRRCSSSFWPTASTIAWCFHSRCRRWQAGSA